MASSICLCQKLKNIFLFGVNAVKAESLFRKENIHISDDSSNIICNFNNHPYTINVENKQCHLVGFGKAVYSMAFECSKVLGNQLKSGILNVPLKTIETFPDIRLPATIQVYECAKNNLPDTDAEYFALKIFNYVHCLGENDVLFIMVSGGGSALLPLPCDGVTLLQKQELIKSLANKGATINEINRVRIDLSKTKGGKLAFCAKRAHTVLAFIISDIIGDPLDLIASGPTVLKSIKSGQSPIDILKKFEMWETLAENIKEAIIKSANTQQNYDDISNIKNILIANNVMMVCAVSEYLKRHNIPSIVLSTGIEGNVTEISKAYYELCENIQLFRRNKIGDVVFEKRNKTLTTTLRIRDSFFSEIKQIICESIAQGTDLCVIVAGELTVNVIGSGLGGRNQELALRFSKLCYANSSLRNIWLLASGTDGIDGNLLDFTLTQFKPKLFAKK